MTLAEISKKFLPSLIEGQSPKFSQWPSSIILESAITENNRKINKMTNSEGFFSNREQGAVGNEFAFSVLYFYDQIYISKVFGGDKQSVSISHRYGAKPVYTKDNSKLNFEISFDEKIFKTKLYDSKLFSGTKLNHGIVATFHSHPKFYIERGVSQFTFFSSQDISSLLHGRTPVLGLVAGSDVWLACKSDISSMIPGNLLQEATRLELEKGNDEVAKFVKSNLKDFGIPIYKGKIGSRLERVC